MKKKIISLIICGIMVSSTVEVKAIAPNLNIGQVNKTIDLIKKSENKITEEIDIQNTILKEKDKFLSELNTINETDFNKRMDFINSYLIQNYLNNFKLQINIPAKEKEIENQEKKYSEIQKQFKIKEENYNAILVNMYKKGKTAEIKLLLDAENFMDLIDKTQLAQQIAKSDLEVIQSFKKIKKESEITLSDLNREKLNLEKNKRLITERNKFLFAIQQEQINTLKNLKEKELNQYISLTGQKNIIDEYKKILDTNLQTNNNLIQEKATLLAEIESLQKDNKNNEIIELKKKRIFDIDNQILNLAKPVTQCLWPTAATEITSNFGIRSNPTDPTAGTEFHSGIDIAGPLGTPIFATKDGVVKFAGEAGGYGNKIELDHGNDLTSVYGHLSSFSVKSGDVVTRGQIIGHMGSTGRSTGSHLHFEIRLSGTPTNPINYIK